MSATDKTHNRTVGTPLEGYAYKDAGLYECAACGGDTVFHRNNESPWDNNVGDLYECLKCGAVETWYARVGFTEPV